MATVSEKEWTGFQGLPAATQIILHTLLAKLRKQKVDKITIVLLGKGGVGKSSIVNSLFSERVAAVSAFRSETLRPRQYSRSKDGFKLTVIDTPGFVEAGRVDAALNSIRRYLLGKTINVVLYVDRLDGPREDKVDVKISRAISQAFGPQIWPHVIVVFTHAEIHLEDVTYSEFVSRRSAALRNIILKESRFKTVNTKVPFVLVENCSRCSENGEHEKILPDGTVWLPVLFEALVDLVLGSKKPILIDEKMIGISKGNPLGSIWMPLVLLAQFVLIWRPIRKAIDRDLVEEAQRHSP
ncbi:translocase of chloroplast 34 isoform X1 [Physcomitrium patens]|uniref:AIG1-type G domain-containing protein n=1 Tax=Physcomitrium patens TaxID=3218 RepID=A9RF68_PHYPA|nr:uncharacterized protein LOC112277693 isoform X1 [Physcomitrium patens]XP_024366082.1 uncharacterized protein LOC112277693 isoform X1 [Physcomitrium patens]XP_024366083.1 uncharacterized protein LOC112277693 isoform X1 [Physcomitrium patens]XP_024366084.1 uncharacterized protein LOC112277693 isoform X1 [Physcomitrium patens]XP_024366085.1 uncharacterized protein LOC112277693 isoform X1 [Physcomitrium patens]PNR27143.1 hypothetical protein PHYPA_030624 [Physcomitrium patens]|eukprot:XP_024366081.1 uncharacterized protein LOC112277693 isoform X1 [Physcomitrella patens]